jgi:hypothetical protein
MHVEGPHLNPANLYSAVEIKKPPGVGQTLSAGGGTMEEELAVEDVLRISSEMDQDGGQQPDQGNLKERRKKKNDGTSEEEPPEDPMSIWG